MRDIHTSTITDAVKRLCVEANWNLEPTCSACSTAQPAQVTHAEEQKRLADHKGVELALAQGATRVAQEESKREQAVTVKT